MKRVALLVLLVPFATSGATIAVNTNLDTTTAGDGVCSLREAIANVNAAADTTSGDCVAGSGAGDTITFYLSSYSTIRLAPKLGELVVAKDLTIAGPTSGSLTIDGRLRTRVLHITRGSTSISDLTIKKGACPLQDMNAGGGGGVRVDRGATLSLNRCTLTRNTTGRGGFGGGILNEGTATLTNCTLSGNTTGRGGHGGGMSNQGNAALTNCTVSNNRTSNLCVVVSDGEFSCSGGDGGGIENYGSFFPLSVTNCTISRNHATGYNYRRYGLSGGYGGIGGGRLTNTIVAGNFPDDCGYLGAVESGSHNIGGDNTCFHEGTSDLSNTSPHLARRTNSGGTTQTLALCSGTHSPEASCSAASPAIDAGDDSVISPPLNLTTDQRGLPRLAGSHVDIGAFEVQ